MVEMGEEQSGSWFSTKRKDLEFRGLVLGSSAGKVHGPLGSPPVCPRRGSGTGVTILH
jgi:hypothetical protein